MNEPVKNELITQENLPTALKEGRITQAEVDNIWDKTWFLSAQTPIEVRMWVAKFEQAGIVLAEHDKLVLGAICDMRAALFRDESKFAHLVAGTETIVKTLQKVNPLVQRLERQEMMIDSLTELLERTEAKIDMLMQAVAEGGKKNLGDLTIKHEVLTGGDEEAEFLAKTAADALSSPITEQTEEAYDGNVGSAWDPKNPAKGPVKLPTASEEYEKQSKDFRERILKHS